MGIEDLIGKVITKVEGLSTREDEITFVCADGSEYKMYHEQDCCESVSIEDITGNPDSLIGLPVLEAYESGESDETAPESGTWTFYHIRNNLDTITIRWYGSSNGYYSESACFIQTVKPREIGTGFLTP
jgi:hypothetical protein